MLVTKRIQIEFADPTIKAIDYIQDIRKAAENAGLNLFSRYDVQLLYPMPDGDRVVVEIKIPEEIVDTFAVGNHLRGISTYLLSKGSNRYHQYLIGKRLLNYIELDEEEKKESGLATVDRLEAVSVFAKLLERNDEDAMDAISRIILILNEVKQSWE